MLNGLILLGAELLKRRSKEKSDISQSDSRIAKLKWVQAFGVGLAQSVALIPGFSRTGSAIGGGLLMGLSHEDAARFSFLLATPIIGAAAVLKLPELFSSSNTQIIIPTLIGAISAGVSSYFAIKFLVKYFQTRTLTPFGVYCLSVGIIISFWLLRS